MTGRRYTLRQRAALRRLYHARPASVFARWWGRSKKGIRQLARRTGIKKRNLGVERGRDSE